MPKHTPSTSKHEYEEDPENDVFDSRQTRIQSKPEKLSEISLPTIAEDSEVETEEEPEETPTEKLLTLQKEYTRLRRHHFSLKRQYEALDLLYEDLKERHEKSKQDDALIRQVWTDNARKRFDVLNAEILSLRSRVATPEATPEATLAATSPSPLLSYYSHSRRPSDLLLKTIEEEPIAHDIIPSLERLG